MNPVIRNAIIVDAYRTELSKKFLKYCIPCHIGMFTAEGQQMYKDSAAIVKNDALFAEFVAAFTASAFGNADTLRAVINQVPLDEVDKLLFGDPKGIVIYYFVERGREYDRMKLHQLQSALIARL